MSAPDAFGCVAWSGRLDKDGYGRDGAHQAHVRAYVNAYGDLPAGVVIDHLCRRRWCVAPHHLEAVTKDVNEQRKSLQHRARRMKCPMGHDLALNRVMTPEGGIVCRACNRSAR